MGRGGNTATSILYGSSGTRDSAMDEKTRLFKKIYEELTPLQTQVISKLIDLDDGGKERRNGYGLIFGWGADTLTFYAGIQDISARESSALLMPLKRKGVLESQKVRGRKKVQWNFTDLGREWAASYGELLDPTTCK